MANKLKSVDPKKIVIEKNFNSRNAELVKPIDADLVQSVEAAGVTIPLHVRVKKGKTILIAGERRLRAALLAKVKKVPVIDHGEIDDKDAHEIAFAENFARKDLSALEAGKAAKLLLAEYKGDAEAAGSKLGKSAGWVKQRVRIIDSLDDDVIENIEREAPQFTASHLQVIAAFEPEMQMRIMEDLFEDDTVENVRDKAAKLTHCLKFAPWDITEGVGDFPACIECRFRTSIEPGLFDDITENGKPTVEDRCTDFNCWEAKKRKFLELEFEKEKKNHPDLQFATKKWDDSYEKQQLAELSGKSVLNNVKVQARAGKNTKPVMVIDDAGFGKIKYVKINEPVEQKTEKETGSCKKTMAEKRKALLCKRWTWICEKIHSMIDDYTFKDDFLSEKTFDEKYEAVCCIAAVFGAPINHWRKTQERESVDWELFDAFMCGATQVLIADEIFELIKVPLKELVSYNGPITLIPDEKITSSNRIAELFDVDIDDLFEKACQKYKEPKAWAGQKEE